MEIKLPFLQTELPQDYGKYAAKENRLAGKPVVSFPFTIKDAPAGTKSFALTFIDHDAVPVAGFSWIHWLAANIEQSEIPANFSQLAPSSVKQGFNSNISKFVGETNPALTSYYTGPMPPNGDHAYTLTVYAVDKLLPLPNNYYLNDLYHALTGHTLAKTSLDIISKA
ncbi:Raf kinase inhibitor-like YbhB/YbcL family protein [Weissella beninensis]|uniref:YbhB/YbcL family Raf kinase inhibitor-like protein n=1 Tax=Periweissella beninensis TaxID=504936 RepID=A0ABT0VI15_9LACO|nr:YbhB/YbcL family Raf kinase inhibitor-like protein [Periweissella beninensis]MBM7544152.1 Raf kinase inhibitor-like YbhB/YbcL family protein [Periweissella beninensis]MCM2437474.1 YbhB/YbcL family Raf kinase inhibitor-like protein [Periweissella beninensis]